jgi:transcriptional regulator with XRE-family HTH domain
MSPHRIPPKDDILRDLGELLRAARASRGLSLQDVEDQSDGRWHRVVVGSYERGDRSITVPRLIELADFYGMPARSFLPAAPGEETRMRELAEAAIWDRVAEYAREQAAGKRAWAGTDRETAGERSA